MVQALIKIIMGQRPQQENYQKILLILNFGNLPKYITRWTLIQPTELKNTFYL